MSSANTRRRSHAWLGRWQRTPAAQSKNDPQAKGVSQVEPLDSAGADLDQVELGPACRRGAAAALERLEEIEERAHARLIQAIEGGNQFQIKAAQEFYLRSSETLRRLDLAVETERRKADEQLPIWQVEDVSLQIAIWLRTAFERFLSAETVPLMAIADLGEFKAHAIERFKGILHLEVRTSLRINPPIPDWAAAQVIEALERFPAFKDWTTALTLQYLLNEDAACVRRCYESSMNGLDRVPCEVPGYPVSIYALGAL